MSSETIATVKLMMESLPEEAQERVVDHLREYITEMLDDLRWDHLFATTLDKLEAMAEKAEDEIARGLAEPMDFSRL